MFQTQNTNYLIKYFLYYITFPESCKDAVFKEHWHHKLHSLPNLQCVCNRIRNNNTYHLQDSCYVINYLFVSFLLSHNDTILYSSSSDKPRKCLWYFVMLVINSPIILCDIYPPLYHSTSPVRRYSLCKANLQKLGNKVHIYKSTFAVEVFNLRTATSFDADKGLSKLK